MSSVELSMLPEASAGRAAAQFIVRSKGVGGAATNKQKAGFRESGSRPFSFVGTTKHCLLVLFRIYFFNSWQFNKSAHLNDLNLSNGRLFMVILL
jgi:hypothetical protein